MYLLKELSLAYNELSSLPSTLFKNCISLGTVHFNVNRLTFLPSTLFKHCSNLGYIDLSDNFLTSLPPTLFENCPNLIYLNLSDNCLTSLHPALFENCTKLDAVNLEGNKLTFLTYNLFEKCINLKHIFICYNRLTFVSSTFRNFIIFEHYNQLIEETSENKSKRQKFTFQIEERKKEMDINKNRKKLNYVIGEIETIPPDPLNYSNLPCFSLWKGGSEFHKGLELLGAN